MAPVSKGNSAACTWDCNASGYESTWQSCGWRGTGDADDSQDGKRRKTWIDHSTQSQSDNGASSSGPRRTSLLSQEKRLNEELRLACNMSISVADFKLPENLIWQPPMADRTTAPVQIMYGWYKRNDYQTCIADRGGTSPSRPAT